MKYFCKASFFAILLGFVAMQGCKSSSGPGESIEDIQLGKLQKTWTVTSVTLDDKVQDQYAGFTLTITGTAGSGTFNYSTANRPNLSPWPNNGPWKFGANPETQIIRDEGNDAEVDITYSLTDTKFQITFNFSGAGFPNSRTTNVKGEWVFTFTG